MQARSTLAIAEAPGSIWTDFACLSITVKEQRYEQEPSFQNGATGDAIRAG